MKFVTPKTYITGVTGITDGLYEYLRDSGNEEFLETIKQAEELGISPGEILCSFYAKLCYKSLTLGQNNNVTRIRDIESNLIGCFNSGHGSVFEHCFINLITTNCSRVFTHELVRHRVGTAFSQTSGRYVALDQIDFVIDPVLSEYTDDIIKHLEDTEKLATKLRDGLIKDGDSFDKKKKITSAIRRIAPNGQANEIGWSLNIRSLRHTLILRTNRHAEWEIRYIFNELGALIEEKWPLMLYGLNKVDTKDGLFEWVSE